MDTCFYQKRWFAVCLTFIGGAMDAYTFIHYTIFPVAQSGNTIMVIADLYDGDFRGAAKKLMAILFFILGTAVAKGVNHYFSQSNDSKWSLRSLFFEAVVFAGLGLPVMYAHPTLVIAIIAFTVAIQWYNFNSVEGRSYVNLYASGNIKGLVTSLFDFKLACKSEEQKEVRHYLSLVASFVLGAGLSIIVYHWLLVRGAFFIGSQFLLLLLLSLWDKNTTANQSGHFS